MPVIIDIKEAKAKKKRKEELAKLIDDGIITEEQARQYLALDDLTALSEDLDLEFWWVKLDT